MEKYLPQKTQVILKCDMSAWQKVYYQQVTDVGRVGLDTGKWFLTLCWFEFWEMDWHLRFQESSSPVI